MKEAISQANNYLNGNLQYDVGVSIFMKLSKNLILARHFLQGYSAQREDKLKYELKKLTKQNEQIQKPSTKPLRSRSNEPDPITTHFSESPQKNINQDGNHPSNSDRYSNISSSDVDSGLISNLNQKRKELYRFRGHLHGQLHSAPTDESRYELAHQIMKTQSSIDVLNRDINSTTVGSIPSKYLKKDKTADEYVRIRNLKTYIARFEKKLEGCTTVEEKEKLQSILKKHKEELKSML